MKPKDKQKICAHCHGRIAVEADSCPYCGMPLLGSVASLPPEPQVAAVNSLYPPPYSNRNVKVEHDINNPFEKIQEASEKEEKTIFIPLGLTLAGSTIFTLGLLLLTFSDHGILRLEWNASYWFWYCLAAIPMIYFGVKKAKDV